MASNSELVAPDATFLVFCRRKNDRISSSPRRSSSSCWPAVVGLELVDRAEVVREWAALLLVVSDGEVVELVRREEGTESFDVTADLPEALAVALGAYRERSLAEAETEAEAVLERTLRATGGAERPVDGIAAAEARREELLDARRFAGEAKLLSVEEEEEGGIGS